MKKILLLAPSFYGYEKEIVKELESDNYIVNYINNHPSKRYETYIGIANKIGLGYKWLIDIFAQKVYSKIKDEKYDDIIVINGKAITSLITHRLRTNNVYKEGKMILYYWDSIAQVEDDIKRWDDFDAIYTFDNVDYEMHKNRMKFIPLFYCEKFWKKQNSKPSYDTMLVGSFSIHRYRFLKNVAKQNPSLKIGSYLYVAKWLIRFHKTFRPKYKYVKYEDLKFQKLSFQDVVNQYLSSKAVVDIPMPGQNGLTIRTIESLAMHKKIITTNSNIKFYDFYNKDDIYIVNTDDYILPSIEWFNKPFSISDEIIEKYSISNWVKELIK